MNNYKNYLKELFTYQTGLSENTVIREIDLIPINILEKAKNSFKILYKYPDLMSFKPTDTKEVSSSIIVEIRGYNSNTMLIDTYRPQTLRDFVPNKSREVSRITLNKTEFLILNNKIAVYTDQNIIRATIETIMDVISIAVKMQPEVFTRDVVSTMLKDINFERSLKSSFIKQELKDTLHNLLKIDYEKELKTLINQDLAEKREINQIRRDIEQLLKINSSLETKQESTLRSILNLQELIDSGKQEDYDLDLLNDIYNGLYTNPLIKSVKLDIIGRGILKVKLLTNPVPITHWNMSPYNFLEKLRTTKTEITKELYRSVYDQEGIIDAYFSPYFIEFTLDVGATDRRIINIDIYPSFKDFGNPHKNHGCYGNFSNHIVDASKTGNILKLISVLAQYLGTITVGDLAGNKFHLFAILTKTGEQPVWEKQRNEELLELKAYLKNQKEQQN